MGHIPSDIPALPCYKPLLGFLCQKKKLIILKTKLSAKVQEPCSEKHKHPFLDWEFSTACKDSPQPAPTVTNPVLENSAYKTSAMRCHGKNHNKGLFCVTDSAEEKPHPFPSYIILPSAQPAGQAQGLSFGYFLFLEKYNARKNLR